MQILDFFAHLKAPFLHAGGEYFSRFMVTVLDPKTDEFILDFGCGTAATLVMVYSISPQTRLMGIDQSHLMVQSGKKRLKYCGLEEEINILHTKDWNPSKYKGKFDKIYVESVLAIQNSNELRTILKQLHSLLKPSGLLIVNETLWLESTEEKVIRSINAQTEKLWGIIQSNPNYPSSSHWETLFQESGFMVKNVHESLPKSSFRENKISQRSNRFSKMAKVKALLNPIRLFQYFWMRRQESNITSGLEKLMQGYVFELTKTRLSQLSPNKSNNDLPD